MKVNIGFTVVRTDGQRAVYGHVITKFSGMGRFTKRSDKEKTSFKAIEKYRYGL